MEGGKHSQLRIFDEYNNPTTLGLYVAGETNYSEKCKRVNSVFLI